MTEIFAARWAAGCAGMLMAAFISDLVFGPFWLTWVPNSLVAFLFGAACAAVGLGPMIWLAVTDT